MKTPAEIIDHIGPDRVKDAVGVSADRVRLARLDPLLPASWYIALAELAGVELPHELFSFKGVA